MEFAIQAEGLIKQFDVPAGLPAARAFDALDRSWTVLARSPEAAAALDRWSGATELVAPDLDAPVPVSGRDRRTDGGGASLVPLLAVEVGRAEAAAGAGRGVRPAVRA